MASDVVLAEYRLELDGFKKDIDEINKKFDQTQKNTNKQGDQMNKTFAKLGGVIAGAFAVGQLVSFGKEMVRLTAEFQRFEAVLTNTLGSESAAKKALDEIQRFAAETPFQINELTGAFVKLANFGLKISVREMRSLGDVAASTGKSFDQLAEAVIDATTGEFERLKEFGIRASKSGDQVTFTFKGVQTQVDFTTEAIQGYILSLGELEGVSGSMAAISETLGGRISMLQDAWENLLRTLGDNSNSILSRSIDFLTKLTITFTDLGEAIRIATQRANESDLFTVLERGFFESGESIAEQTRELTEGLLEMPLDEFVKNLEYARAAFLNIAFANGESNEAAKKLADTYLEFIKGRINESLQETADVTGKVKTKTEETKTAVENLNDELEIQKLKVNSISDAWIAYRKALSRVAEDAPKVADRTGRFVDAAAFSSRMLQREIDTIEQQFDSVNQTISIVGQTLNALNLNDKQSALLQIALSQAQIIASAAEAAAKAGADAGAGAPIVTPAILATTLAQTLPNIVSAYQIVRSAEVPRYYEGTNYLTGAKGKDQIPVMANYGERIIPTLDNAKIGRDVTNKELVDLVMIGKVVKKMSGVASFDYNKFQKIDKKGALTVANEVKKLREDVSKNRFKNSLIWQ